MHLPKSIEDRLTLGAVLLAVLATLLTVLGGLVLAFDNSLWPLDAYVLNAGQFLHILTVICSGAAMVFGLRTRHLQGFSPVSFFISTGIFLTSAMLLVLTWPRLFVYGLFPR